MSVPVPNLPIDAHTDARTTLEREILTLVARAIETRHYSRNTGSAYALWIRRYLRFTRYRDPRRPEAKEVSAFLTSLAVDHKVSSSTQNQALSALLFLFQDSLGIELPWLDQVVRAKRSHRLPVVLTREEVLAILGRMRGTPALMAALLYGCGMRLLECCRLRVKDVDFGRREIIVREGKGDRDRRTMLPSNLRDHLHRQIDRVARLHGSDLEDGAGWVELPYALERKHPQAGRELGWQWVFPATRFYVESVSGHRRRHHLHESVIQRSFREALLAARIRKPASPHTLRHYAESWIMPSGCCELLESQAIAA